ncbi:hypothetical protein AB0J86_10790 [Micromonospora sp. NPDC049559]|uniref:hypothetical protein n=1 Tax=Micromonospora sp. NPDC049559 TaxID=3155923 RepID=UPI00344A86B7
MPALPSSITELRVHDPAAPPVSGSQPTPIKSAGESHAFGQLGDGGGGGAPDTFEDVAHGLPGGGTVADLVRGEAFGVQQRLGGGGEIPGLGVRAGQVEQMLRPAFRYKPAEGRRVDETLDVEGLPAVAERDGGADPVQQQVRGAETRPVVIVVAAEGAGRLARAVPSESCGLIIPTTAPLQGSNIAIILIAVEVPQPGTACRASDIDQIPAMDTQTGIEERQTDVTL